MQPGLMLVERGYDHNDLGSNPDAYLAQKDHSKGRISGCGSTTLANRYDDENGPDSCEIYDSV